MGLLEKIFGKKKQKKEVSLKIPEKPVEIKKEVKPQKIEVKTPVQPEVKIDTML